VERQCASPLLRQAPVRQPTLRQKAIPSPAFSCGWCASFCPRLSAVSLCLSPPVSRRIAPSCFICGYMSAPFTTVLSIFAVSDIPTLRNRSRSHGLNLKTRTHKEVQKKSPQQTSRFYQYRGRSSQERKLGTDNQERQFENANTKAGSVRVDT